MASTVFLSGLATTARPEDFAAWNSPAALPELASELGDHALQSVTLDESAGAGLADDSQPTDDLRVKPQGSIKPQPMGASAPQRLVRRLIALDCANRPKTLLVPLNEHRGRSVSVKLR